MKIINRLFAVVAIVFSGSLLSANAQTVSEIQDSNKRMMSASTPCNQGPEAFKDFIVKFNTDKDFLDSRLQLSAAQREKYASVLVPGEFEAKNPMPKDGDEWYQSWGELQFGKAYLQCGWVDSFVDYIFEFKRDNGKWYLANIVAED